MNSSVVTKEQPGSVVRNGALLKNNSYTSYLKIVIGVESARKEGFLTRVKTCLRKRLTGLTGLITKLVTSLKIVWRVVRGAIG